MWIRGKVPFSSLALKFLIDSTSFVIILKALQEQSVEQDEDWFLSPSLMNNGRRRTSARADSIQPPSSSSHSSPFPETPKRIEGSVPPESSITISTGNDEDEVFAMDMDTRDLEQGMVKLEGKRPIHSDD